MLLRLRKEGHDHVLVSCFPLDVVAQNELVLIFQHAYRHPQLRTTPALPLLIQRVCSSWTEKTFSPCAITSPLINRRSTWPICRLHAANSAISPRTQSRAALKPQCALRLLHNLAAHT